MDEKRKLIQEVSLDNFQEQREDGTNDALMELAFQLIKNHPDKTANELHQLGIEDGVYDEGSDRNIIAPYTTNLAKQGRIIRPNRRTCTVSNRKNPQYTHQIIPDKWAEHLKYLIGIKGTGPYVKHRMEIPSSKNTNILHTVVWWTDGSVSCTCHELYNRPSDLRCHHAIGMIKAVTGKEPDEIDWKAKYEELQMKYDQLIEQHKVLQKAYAERDKLAKKAPLFGTRDDDEDFS